MGKSRSTPAPQVPGPPAPGLEASLETCQRILRSLTGVMIAAFGLIVVLTTASTGPFVQVLGRGLYFLILASAMASLVTWIWRLRIERRMERHGPVPARVSKRM